MLVFHRLLLLVDTSQRVELKVQPAPHWRLNGRVLVYLDVRNLTDEAYVSNVQAQIAVTPTTAAYWPGDGRAVFGGLALSF